MPPLLQLLRPHQWIKNSFVFAGIIFAHLWADTSLVHQAILATISFCLLSSAMYIINDILDKDNDARHPFKKNRPLARKAISNTTAYISAIILVLAAIGLGFFTTFYVGWILVSYAILSVVYSCWLKYLMFIDILALSFGFLLRVLAGTTGIGIPPSKWLLLCTLLLTLFLGLNKRRTEQRVLLNAKLPLPTNLKQYSLALLDKMVMAAALGALLSYTIYTVYQMHILHYWNFVYTLPLVAYGIFRYLYLTFHQLDGPHGLDIARDLLCDQQLLASILLWAVIIIWLSV